MTDQSPGKYDWGTVVSGDTVRARTFDFTPLDLTDYTARVYFRESPASPVAVALLTPGNIDAPSGSQLRVGTFPAPDVTLTTENSYDLELTSPDGVVQTYLRGTLTVLPAITRDG